MPSSGLYAYFVHILRRSKQCHSNRNLHKKGLKIESFLQKKKKLFCVFFLRPPAKVTKFNTSPMPQPPSLENFSLDTLNSEQKPSVKKTVDRAGRPAMILKFNGRVEKILTGSISGTYSLLYS